jgi:hypothetical protein
MLPEVSIDYMTRGTKSETDRQITRRIDPAPNTAYA